jgi:hypothetical protein
MPAQLGDSIELVYGPQGAQQLGDDLVLDYSALSTTTRVSSSLHAPWAEAAILKVTTQARFVPTDINDITDEVPWGSGQALDTTDASPWVVAAPQDNSLLSPWVEFGKALQVPSMVPWGVALPKDESKHAPWGYYERRPSLEPHVPWGVSAFVDQMKHVPWLGPLARVDILSTARFAQSTGVDVTRWIPWLFYSTFLQPTTGILVPEGDGEEAFDTFLIPIRNTYIMINSFSMARYDDATAINVKSCSITADVDTWSWGISAELPRKEFDKVSPIDGPVSIEVHVNEQIWRFKIDDVSRSRSFPSENITISGRSLTSELDEPNAPLGSYMQTESLDAVQLAQAELDRPGIDPAYILDWNLNGALGWTVPSGWSFNGLSPIRAIKEIVESVGGYVQSHPYQKYLKVRSRYPVGMWDLPDETPNVVLPWSVMLNKGWRWDQSPEYNGIWVSGEQVGVSNLVKRTGSAGDILLPDYVHRLITEDDASREKGRVALSECGNRAFISAEVPLSDDVPLMFPGNVIEVADGGMAEEANWKGYLRGTAITCNWSGTLKVRQSITIERRYFAP